MVGIALSNPKAQLFATKYMPGSSSLHPEQEGEIAEARGAAVKSTLCSITTACPLC